MKETILLRFNAGDLSHAELERIFERAESGERFPSDPPPSVVPVYFIRFPATDPRLERLRDLLAGAGVDWDERLERTYTDRELRRSPLLVMTPRVEKGFGGPTHGTEYDLSDACPRCGTGARQTSPLIVDGLEVSSRQSLIQTLDREFLLAPELADRLRERGISGASLLGVKSARHGFTLPWTQLLPTFEMPPMHPSSTGIERERPCPQCMRDGYFHDANHPLELAYTQSSLGSLPDVVHTFERFGNSGLREPFCESHFASPLILISPDLYEIFRKASVRASFEPVRAVDDTAN